MFLGYVNAEHAPEGRLVAPNLWATLSVHVVASPGSHGAPEVGGVSVRNFGALYISRDAAGAPSSGRWLPVGVFSPSNATYT